jgi:hypothetical protein
MSSKLVAILVGAVLLLLGAASPAAAHEANTTAIEVSSTDSGLDVQVDLPIDALGTALGEEIPTDTFGLSKTRYSIVAYISDHVSIGSAEAGEWPLTLGQIRVISSDGRNYVRAAVTTLRYGFDHVLDGADHLLFLLTLLLPAPLIAAAGRWSSAPGFWRGLKRVLHVATAFMIGHSISLAASAFDLISLPSRPIAVGIIVSPLSFVDDVAVDNLGAIAVGLAIVAALAWVVASAADEERNRPRGSELDDIVENDADDLVPVLS